MIKLIAVDMDGTFLDEMKTYDKQRFQAAYQRMKAHGISFVVASGNQYYQISSFFDDEDILYAAENGAWIRSKEKELASFTIPYAQVRDLVIEVNKIAGMMVFVCAKKACYISREEHRELVIRYFPRLELASDLSQIDDEIFKISILYEPHTQVNPLAQIRALLPQHMQAMDAGEGCIDIIQEGIHKGNALAFLCSYLHIDKEQCMCFGDSGNDLEMLRFAKYSYAMENATVQAKAAANFIAPHHSQAGVLSTIEAYLDELE